MKIAITGGAGFIGSALIRWLLKETEAEILNLDKLTYAGNRHSLPRDDADHRHRLAEVDICDRDAVLDLLLKFRPNAVMHLAAESHVDRSIDGPSEFVRTNVQGTFELLEATREYWSQGPASFQKEFRFLHISTDEVYGDLGGSDALFTETSNIQPSSPYAATKAASDHLVSAWHRTYGLPTVITNCSNNYGPCQFPEKLIPHMILSALKGDPLPIYGDGKQIRDWLYVDDHASALYKVLTAGQTGETYNVGGLNEHRNIDIVRLICKQLESVNAPKPAGVSRFEDLITHVTDRPGHDTRYAVDPTKLQTQLGWAPQETFATGLAKTVDWYLNNPQWWQQVLDGTYRLERRGNKG